MPIGSSKWRTDVLSRFLDRHLPLLLIWLALGVVAGLSYGFEMVGLDATDTLLSPERARSLHISQMLYGFFPLLLSLLPFALFEKEGVLTEKALRNLDRYMRIWHLFLLFMSMAIIFGNIRGLPFYDFPYVLNFLLAFSGVFYLFALLDALKRYAVRPLWVNVSLAAVVAAPIVLVILMNPQYGQVEHTLIGPHGDNTLGMSFALIPIYYLLFKLNADKGFIPRFHLLWIIPLAGYLLSLVVRNFFHSLSYAEEWFFQYLTLLYLPLLWIWMRDSGVGYRQNPYLLLSVAAFAFVDLEGNLLFIPEIRTLIHRNDLVVAHAHIAMGLAVAFMALSIAYRLLPAFFRPLHALVWSVLMVAMATALSYAGLIEGGIVSGSVESMLWLRDAAGIGIALIVLVWIYQRFFPDLSTLISWYHLIGLKSDAGGGVILMLFGSLLFPALGWHFGGTYEYVVFAFMIGTGMIHYAGLYGADPHQMAELSARVRALVASVFAALYMAGTLEEIALLVALYDGAYAMIYWLWLKDRQ